MVSRRVCGRARELANKLQARAACRKELGVVSEGLPVSRGRHQKGLVSHPLIHLFHTCLSSPRPVPGPVPGARDTSGNKTKSLPSKADIPFKGDRE